MDASILAIALATITIAPANVTRCFAPRSPTEELAKATAVFSGKVVRREYVPEATSEGEFFERLIIRIAVERVWKGDIYADATMYTSETHLANGYVRIFGEDFNFEDDKEYLIYAFGKTDRLSTDVCTRTRELSKADDDLKELGDGNEPKIRN